jgi:hypothetical protein
MRKSAHMNLAALQDSKAFSDDGEISFVEVTERPGRSLACDLAFDKLASVATLLHGNLHHTRERLAVLFQACCISYDKDFRVIRYG